MQVFSIRGGHLLGRENFILEHVTDEEDRDVIRDFLQQFYGRSMQIPQSLFLPSRHTRRRITAHVAARAARRLRGVLNVPKIGENGGSWSWRGTTPARACRTIGCGTSTASNGHRCADRTR